MNTLHNINAFSFESFYVSKLVKSRIGFVFNLYLCMAFSNVDFNWKLPMTPTDKLFCLKKSKLRWKFIRAEKTRNYTTGGLVEKRLNLYEFFKVLSKAFFDF